MVSTGDERQLHEWLSLRVIHCIFCEKRVAQICKLLISIFSNPALTSSTLSFLSSTIFFVSAMNISKLPNKKPRFDEETLVCDKYWLPTELIAYVMRFFDFQLRLPLRLVSKKWYVAYDLYHRNTWFNDVGYVFNKPVTRRQFLNAFVTYGRRLHYDGFSSQRWMGDFVAKLSKLRKIVIREYGFTADEHLADEMDKAIAAIPRLREVNLGDVDLDLDIFPGPNMKECASQIVELRMSIANIEPELVASTFTMFKSVRQLGLRGISGVDVLKEVTEMMIDEKSFPKLQVLDVRSEFDLSHADPSVNEDGSKVTAMDLYLKICSIRRPRFDLYVGFILGACSTTNSVLIEKEREFVISLGKISAEVLSWLELTHHTPSGDYDPLTTLFYEMKMTSRLIADLLDDLVRCATEARRQYHQQQQQQQQGSVAVFDSVESVLQLCNELISNRPPVLSSKRKRNEPNNVEASTAPRRPTFHSDSQALASPTRQRHAMNTSSTVYTTAGCSRAEPTSHLPRNPLTLAPIVISNPPPPRHFPAVGSPILNDGSSKLYFGAVLRPNDDIGVGMAREQLRRHCELHPPAIDDYNVIDSVLRALSAFTVRSTLYTLPDDMPLEDEIDIFNTPSTPAASPSTETQSTTATTTTTVAILEEQLQLFMNALCNNPNAAFQPRGGDQPSPVHCRYNVKKINSSKVSGSLHKFAIYPTPFIHAFQRHVTDHSAPSAHDPTSKADYRLVHTFLLQHAWFQRYNDHGSKCKSEGKLVWYVHGRYSNETESWIFEPVQPRIVSSVPTLVKCRDEFSWNAQIAHPRVQSTSLYN
ncbi:hypothetical protein GQ42DRAFT_152488 [Ramicandelaber brevisporus]|nr:hypothetical protein GQ42DRAFT_152488 [Ramicandelaber brevisporus]